MAFTEKQTEYLYNATHRWNIKSGATRSGKTYLDYFVIPKRIRAVRGKSGLVVVLGNTKASIQRNIIEPLQEIWGVRYVSDIGSDNVAYMFGEKVHCLGADKISQVDVIRGSSIKYCYGDEVVTWHKDVFNMLKSRLDKSYSCFDGTCNPDNPEHWFKVFLDNEKGLDIYLQEYALDDNPFLEDDVRENLKREYAGTVFYDRYVLGMWVPAEGLVYPHFSDEKHVIDFKEPIREKDDGLYYISIDYGTMNPFSMGLWRVENGIAVRVKEYYHDGREKRKQLTDEEYYMALTELAGNRVIQYVVIDPSAASFIACIKKHGRFSVKKAANDVLNGIRVTSTMLNSGRILFDRSCKATIKEFRSYSWDEKAQKDTVIKEHDHAMDDIRYFCYTVLRREWHWEDLTAK